jgi:hypothetical protein
LGLQQDWDLWHAVRSAEAAQIGRLTRLPRAGWRLANPGCCCQRDPPLWSRCDFSAVALQQNPVSLERITDFMYQPKYDRVIELSGTPQADIGTPFPIVLVTDSRVSLAYYMTRDTDDPSARPGVVPSESIALVRFEGVRAHYFGPPNDEALNGHPLYSRGLLPYAFSEVLDSSWLQSLVAMNAVHPHHEPRHFAGLRHLIFTFKENTFECISRGYSWAIMRVSMTAAREQILEALAHNAF